MNDRLVAVVEWNGAVSARREALPELQENEVMIKVETSLISPGTEMVLPRLRRAQPEPGAAPVPFGYANAGTIVAVSGNCKDLRVGMRVAAMGANKALHASYTAVPVNLVTPLPDNVSYEQGSYACLGATALQAIRRVQPELGEYGMVLGLGLVGNLVAQLARLSGARIIAWEGITLRRRIAAKCGIKDSVNIRRDDAAAATDRFCAPYGADFAVFAFGGEATTALETVKKCMKRSADGHAMGRIILVGGCRVAITGGADSGNLDFRAASRTGAGYHDPRYEHGADYPDAFVQFTTQRHLREITRLIGEKRLRVDPLTTHRLPISEVGQATDLLIDHPEQALGIILYYPHQ